MEFSPSIGMMTRNKEPDEVSARRWSSCPTHNTNDGLGSTAEGNANRIGENDDDADTSSTVKSCCIRRIRMFPVGSDQKEDICDACPSGNA